MTQEDLMLAMKNMAGMNINVAGDFVMQKTVEHEVNNVEAGGIGIQNVFHNNADKPATAKKNAQKKKSEKKVSDKPHTLKYYTHGNNGALRKQRERLSRFLQDEFGEKYGSMGIREWYNISRDYVLRHTYRNNIQDDENVTWMIAADANDYVPAIATD